MFVSKIPEFGEKSFVDFLSNFHRDLMLAAQALIRLSVGEVSYI